MQSSTMPRYSVVASNAQAIDLIEKHRATLEAMGRIYQAPKADDAATMEYRLNVAQTAFIVTKLDDERAARHTALMSEVFALYRSGRLVPVDPAAKVDLDAALARESLPTA